MKITVYTISDCQYSKQEKEYLTAHSLPFEEKNLETNKEYLTEMLAVSNNFAGTPVTKVEMDDGKVVVLKGYTKEEFDKTLGLSEGAKTDVKPDAAPAPAAAAPVPDMAPVAPPAMPEVPPAPAAAAPAAPEMPVMPPIETAPATMAEPAMPAAPQAAEPMAPVAPQPPMPPAAPAPTAPPVVPANDPSLNALLNDLQSKVNANRAANTPQPNQAPPAPPAQPGGVPSIPEPDFKDHQ